MKLQYPIWNFYIRQGSPGLRPPAQWTNGSHCTLSCVPVMIFPGSEGPLTLESILVWSKHRQSHSHSYLNQFLFGLKVYWSIKTYCIAAASSSCCIQMSIYLHYSYVPERRIPSKLSVFLIKFQDPITENNSVPWDIRDEIWPFVCPIQWEIALTPKNLDVRRTANIPFNHIVFHILLSSKYLTWYSWEFPQFGWKYYIWNYIFHVP